MYYIAKSNSKFQPNWSGKEFSEFPAKIYTDIEDLFSALRGYHYCQESPLKQVQIHTLSEDKKDKLKDAGKIRW